MRATTVILMAAAAVCLGATGVAGAAVSFQRTDIDTTYQLNDLAVGDLDGRNGPDIVVALVGGGLHVRLNNGDGTFGALIGAPSCDARQVLIGDVTTTGADLAADGHPDAVVVCSDGTPARLAGDGAGHFGTQNASLALRNSGLLSDGQETIALARWRAPGLPPVLIYTAHGYSIPEGDFDIFCASYDWGASAGVCDTPHLGAGPILAGEIDNADFDEVFTFGGPLGILAFGIDAGVLNHSDRDMGASAANANHAMAIGDLEPDGRPDLVTAYGDTAGGGVNVLHGASTGLASAAASRFASVPYLQKITIGDYDGDGRNDILGVAMDGHVAVQPGDGRGNVGAPRVVPILGAGDNTSRMDLAGADVDRNGSADAIVLDRGRGKLEILRNLTPAYVPPAPAPPVAPPAPVPAVPKPKPPVPVNPLPGGLLISVTAGRDGAFVVGKAKNPPTAFVALTVTQRGATSSAARKKATKIASKTYKVPARRTVTLKLTLSKQARATLRRKGRIKATLKVVATGTDGTRKTSSRSLTIKRRR